MNEGQHVYRRTRKRLRIIGLLEKSTRQLEEAAVLMEQGNYAHDAHRTRNIAQSASARKEVIELTWQQEDAAQPAARKGKAKK